MATLLQKAKQAKTIRASNRLFSKDDLELVEAWLNDEVELQAIRRVKGFTQGLGIYTYLCFGARELYRRKRK